MTGTFSSMMLSLLSPTKQARGIGVLMMKEIRITLFVCQV